MKVNYKYQNKFSPRLRNEPELLDTEHARYSLESANYFTKINGNKQVM
jgi:hypothetical protein